jgi:hypothetical protein
MGVSEPNGERATGMVDAVVDAATEAAQSVRTYLASDRGKRLRRGVAAVVIVGAPLASELPILRRTPLARVLRAAGVVALVVKGAEWLRDWEPAPLPEIPPAV